MELQRLQLTGATRFYSRQDRSFRPYYQQEKMTIQKEQLIKETYKNLKSDLLLCVKYHRRNKPELVREYFGTDQRDKIEEQLQVICNPFSEVQKIQIEKVISDLHIFYSINNESWLKKSKKSLKQKSKSLSERTISEA